MKPLYTIASSTTPGTKQKRSADIDVSKANNEQVKKAKLQDNDEDDYFGKFIVEKMKKFPKKLKNEAKSHIFQYLTELDNSIE